MYQDQKWYFALQDDGTYTISNAKSGRNIVAGLDANGQPRISAPTAHRQEAANQHWWLINQVRDGTAGWALAWKAEHGARAKLSLQVEVCRNETSRFVMRIHRHEEAEVELQQKLHVLGQEAVACQRKYELALTDLSVLSPNVSGDQVASRNVSWNETNMESRSAVLARHWRSKGSAIWQVSAKPPRKVAKDAGLVGHGPQSQSNQFKDQLELLQMPGPGLDVQTPTMCNLKGRSVSMFGLGQDMFPYSCVIVAIVVAAVVMSRRRSQILAAKVAEQEEIIVNLRHDLEEDCILQTGETVGELGFDFGFQVINRTGGDNETERLIKIQCPGVSHADIMVNLIFNGCDVYITRPASYGTAAASWNKRIRFKTSDGLFEFKEDQMQLEQGFLWLVFRAYTFRSRTIRFPRHFSLAASDIDHCWDYPDCDEIGHSYEGISWLSPAIPRTAVQLAAPVPVAKSHQDTASTASTAKDAAQNFEPEPPLRSN